MNAFMLACFKVVVRSIKYPEAIVFLVYPHYHVLAYLMIHCKSIKPITGIKFN